MTTTIAGIFDSHNSAERAISDLEAAGFSRDDIGVVMQDRTAAQTMADDTGTHVAADATTGAVTGGVVGGVGAALLGLGSLVIPGVGPFLAGGIIAAALGGAVTGGVIGALVGLGFGEDEAGYYDTELRGGRTLVTVRTDESRAVMARSVLDRAGARFYAGERAQASMVGATATTMGPQPTAGQATTGPTYPTTHADQLHTTKGAGMDFGPHRTWNEVRPMYQNRWQSRYGTTGRRFEDDEHTYRYGYEMASDPQYRDREWSDSEVQLRNNWSDWSMHNGYRGQDTWENFKENVRESWDEARGARPSESYRREEFNQTSV